MQHDSRFGRFGECRTLSANAVLAWTGSSVVISAVDDSGYLYYWSQAAGGTWNQQLIAV